MGFGRVKLDVLHDFIGGFGSELCGAGFHAGQVLAAVRLCHRDVLPSALEGSIARIWNGRPCGGASLCVLQQWLMCPPVRRACKGHKPRAAPAKATLASYRAP